MSDSDGRHFWIAVEHRGTVDYDVTTVENTYRTLLLQMRLPQACGSPACDRDSISVHGRQ
jgi:hypothetical protein